MSKAVRKYLAEFFGTATLVCAVVGSGIMGSKLSTDSGVVLLINAIATVLVLGLLIMLLAPISGAHFNPAVSLVQAILGNLRVSRALFYWLFQVLGAISGAMVANLMFDLPAVAFSSQQRVSLGTLVAEVIATAGLVLIILVLIKRNRTELIAVSVASWIGAAYFFTSSTSFANPAVTIGRIFTDSFSGISASSVVPFLLAQILGALLGLVVVRTISPQVPKRSNLT